MAEPNAAGTKRVRRKSVSDSLLQSGSVDTTRRRPLKFAYWMGLTMFERRLHGRFGWTIDSGDVLEYCPQPGLVRQMEEAGGGGIEIRYGPQHVEAAFAVEPYGRAIVSDMARVFC
jgi:hypothetical protein